MNGRRALNILVVAGLVLALGLQVRLTPSAAEGYGPCIAVFIEYNSVIGFHWPVGTALTMTIDDPGTPQGVDYQDTQIVEPDPDPYAPESTSARFQPGEAFTIRPGHIVTLSGADQTLTHTVTNLTLEGADMPGDRLWGTADPGSIVEVRHLRQRDIVRYETADAAGNWLADFGIVGDEPGEELIHDFNEETYFMVMQSNGGGHTQIDWSMPSPGFVVQLTQNQASMWDWPLSFPVTLSIDDPGNGPGTDYSTTLDPAPCEWSEGTCFWKDLGDEFRVRAGHLVTLTNGFITQALSVSAVQVTAIDSDADTVSGTAEPGASVHITTQGEIQRHVTADGTGNWAADFSVPGAGEDEQVILDLIPWHEGTAAVSGGYGRTEVTWPVESEINVGDKIKARNWYYGDEVTLTIDDPTTPATPDYTDSGFPGVGPWAYTGLEFDVGSAFRTQPGHIAELAQNSRNKTCIVSPIAITEVDPIGDRVTGVSDPNANVLVFIPLGSGDEWARYRFAQADAGGHWQVDFSQPGTHIIRHPNEIETVDIDSATWGSASVGDDNACFTSIGWQQPLHCLPGDTVQGTVYEAEGMAPLAGATVYFGAFDTGVQRFIAEADEYGAYGCWLPEGQYRIWASGGGYSREYYQEAIFETATQVLVTDSTHLAGVDFTLDLLAATYDQFTFNMTDPVVGDLAVRRAIAHGTDRALIISLTYPGSPIWDTYLPPDHWAHATSGVPQYDYIPQLAQDILTAAGWVDGDGDGVRERAGTRLHVDYYTTADSAMRQLIYDVFAANMADLGVETHLHAIPRLELFADDGPLFGTHEFGIAQFAWGGIDLNDDQGPGWQFDSQSPQNAGLYGNAAADQARANALAVGTRAEKYPYLAEHQVLVMTDLATLPLLQRTAAGPSAPVAEDDGYATDEDVLLTVAAPGVLGNDLDPDGGLLAATLVSDVGHGVLTLNQDGSFSYDPQEDWNGTDSFTYQACDPEGLCDEATGEILVRPVNDPPTATAAPESQEVQYSDGIESVTILASDGDSASLTCTAEGLPDGLSLSEGECTPEGQGASCEWTMSGYALSGAGSYPVTFTVSDGESSAVAGTTVVVEPEDAELALADNPVAVPVVEPGGASGSFTVRLEVWEQVPDQAGYGAAPGDIGLAELSMSLVPIGLGSAVAPTSCSTTVSGSGYEARLTVACTFEGVAVNSYDLVATMGGSFYSGGPVDDVLVVYDPSLGFTTGGGWFYWPGSEDPGSGYLGDRTNWGYTTKYNRQKTKVQGSLLIIRHLADGTIYRLKSNVLNGLSVGCNAKGAFCWASFSGKATFLYPDGSEYGNHTFTLYAEDWGEPGAGLDRFWVRVKDGGQVIEPMSLSTPAPENTVTLAGGNVVVPH